MLTQNINFSKFGVNRNYFKTKIFVKKTLKKYSKDKFNLTLIHKPSIWDKINKENDLMLSGHTHNGQIFPFSFFVRMSRKLV